MARVDITRAKEKSTNARLECPQKKDSRQKDTIGRLANIAILIARETFDYMRQRNRYSINYSL